MRVSVLRECGYEEAALGFSLSYNTSLERTKQILEKYAWGIPGESKFMESMQIWLDVTAPRYWWQEADTYRVGSSKQSESTMHTIMKKELSGDNFEGVVVDFYVDYLNEIVRHFKSTASPETRKELFIYLKNSLPEGFLQRRIWNLNYKTLRNIIEQRFNHKLPQWRVFCDTVLQSVEHPEFLVRKEV